MVKFSKNGNREAFKFRKLWEFFISFMNGRRIIINHRINVVKLLFFHEIGPLMYYQVACLQIWTYIFGPHTCV